MQDAVHLQMHQQDLTMAMMDVERVPRGYQHRGRHPSASGSPPTPPFPLKWCVCIRRGPPSVAVDLIACDLNSASTPGGGFTSGGLPGPD